MTRLLVKLFVPGAADPGAPGVRGRFGVLSGVVGIVTNLLLFLLKFAVGVLAGSISVLADAFNNLSDGASSVITLVGFKLSGMPADEKHPWGHARFEYISGLAVSVLVLLIGFEFLQSSVSKIRNPSPVELSPLLAGVLAASVLIKLWQCLFYRKLGRMIDSQSLLASAMDSRNDVITTAVVVAGAAVATVTGWAPLDGWMGLAVAVFILVSGVGMVRDILNPLLGMAPDGELVREIEEEILGYPSVLGMHDLMVHNYGPGRVFASAHVELPASQDILTSHDIVDRIERDFAAQRGIQLVIHLDPVITDDAALSELRAFVAAAARDIDPALHVHDLRVAEYKSHTTLIFEVTAPPRFATGDDELRQQLQDKINEAPRPYRCIITVDRSYTSTVGRTLPRT